MIEISSDMSDVQDCLAAMTGARSVPRVFVGGKFFGGGDDTVSRVMDKFSVISIQAAAKLDGRLEKLVGDAIKNFESACFE